MINSIPTTIPAPTRTRALAAVHGSTTRLSSLWSSTDSVRPAGAAAMAAAGRMFVAENAGNVANVSTTVNYNGTARKQGRPPRGEPR